MKQPTVTIGVTAFNAEDTIRDALRSALKQTLSAHQIIVVDDCSTDGTMRVLAEFAGRPNVEIHRNTENSGVAVSRNVIVEHATGEFIVFFDDDDVSANDRVETQVRRILDYEDKFAQGAPVLCHTARRQVFPDGHERIEPTMGQRLGRPAPAGLPVARRALMGEPLEDAYGSCATCSQAARTTVYRELGAFDSRFRRCGDSEIAVRHALAGGHFVGISEPLVTQRMTATSEKSLNVLKEFNLMLLKKHRAVFENDTHYLFCRSWLSLKFEWLGGKYIKFVSSLMRLGLRHPILTFRRCRMAAPNWSKNRAFAHFSRKLVRE